MYRLNENKSEQKAKTTYILEPVESKVGQLFLDPNISKISLDNSDLGKTGLLDLLTILERGKKFWSTGAYKKVTHLHLRNTKLSSDYLSTLDKILDILTECVYLDISHNNIKAEGVEKVLMMAQKTKITNLVMQHVYATNLDVFTVTNLIFENKNLRVLDFSDNSLTENQSALLIEKISKTNCKLYMGGMVIQPEYFREEKRKHFSEEDEKETKRIKLHAVNDNSVGDSVVQTFRLITPSRLGNIFKAIEEHFTEYNEKQNYPLDDERKRSDGRRFSFSHNFPRTALDNRFSMYPVSEFPGGYFFCEGPDPGKEKSSAKLAMLNFLNALCSSSGLQAITTLLVIGKATDMEGYYNYFSQSNSYGPYTIKSDESLQEFPQVQKYELMIEKDNREIKKLTVFHVACDVSNKKINLFDGDKDFLYRLCLGTKPNSLLVHCDTGLMFSPTILLSFYLFRNFTTIFSGTTESIINKISGVIAEARKINSLLIPNKELLYTSFELAYYYMRMHCNALWNKKTDNIHQIVPFKTVCLVGSVDLDDTAYQFVRNRLNDEGINLITINVDANKKPSDAITQAIHVTDEIGPSYRRDLIVNSAATKISMLYNYNKLQGVIFLSKHLDEDLLLNIMQEIPKELVKVYISSNFEKYSKSLSSTAIVLSYPVEEMKTENDQTELNVVNNAVGSMLGNITHPVHHKVSSAQNLHPQSIVVCAPANCYDLNLLSVLERLWTSFKYPIRKFLATESETQKEISYLINQEEVLCVIEFPSLEVTNSIMGEYRLKNYELIESKKRNHYIIIPGGIDCLKVDNIYYHKQCIPLENNYLLVTSANELGTMGLEIAKRANNLSIYHKVDILLPINGLTNYQLSLDYREILYETIKNNINSEVVNLAVLNSHINDENCSLKVIELIQQFNLDVDNNNNYRGPR